VHRGAGVTEATSRENGRSARGGPTSPRERILEASSELFSRLGIQGVGVDTIIERAGVAKATFYKHFPSKDALVLAWLRGDARWLDWFSAEVEARTEAPLERLLVTFDVLGEWFRQDDFEGCPFQNSMSEIRDPNHPALQEIRSYVEEVRAWLAVSTEAAHLREPEELASQIRILVAGAIWLAFMTSSSAPAATARAATLELLSARLGVTRQVVEDRINAGRKTGDTD
jgi:AcrR family transcriptional regulator